MRAPAVRCLASPDSPAYLNMRRRAEQDGVGTRARPLARAINYALVRTFLASSRRAASRGRPHIGAVLALGDDAEACERSLTGPACSLVCGVAREHGAGVRTSKRPTGVRTGATALQTARLCISKPCARAGAVRTLLGAGAEVDNQNRASVHRAAPQK